ncbi:MAG: spore coat protein CotJB [Lachnospiraceae bacterium]|nr:spore coat protein CotJB [Lachnospiraceae bacterium]
MRNDYLHQVDMAGFVLDDILLYLDTHPCDADALEYYQRAKERYEEAVKAYTAQVGPLFMPLVPCAGTFSWVEDPWPWEGGCA